MICGGRPTPREGTSQNINRIVPSKPWPMLHCEVRAAMFLRRGSNHCKPKEWPGGMISLAHLLAKRSTYSHPHTSPRGRPPPLVRFVTEELRPEMRAAHTRGIYGGYRRARAGRDDPLRVLDQACHCRQDDCHLTSLPAPTRGIC